MRFGKITTLFLVGLAYTIVTWFLPVFLPEDLATQLLEEDSIIEYWGALCFFCVVLRPGTVGTVWRAELAAGRHPSPWTVELDSYGTWSTTAD